MSNESGPAGAGQPVNGGQQFPAQQPVQPPPAPGNPPQAQPYPGQPQSAQPQQAQPYQGQQRPQQGYAPPRQGQQPMQGMPNQTVPGQPAQQQRPPMTNPALQGQQPGFGRGPVPSQAAAGQTGAQPYSTGQFAGAVQPSAGAAAKKAKKSFPLWMGVVAGAVAASLIAVPVTLFSVGRLFTPVLDQGALQTGVTKVLKEDFGIAGVKDVECPSGQTAVIGTEFECTFTSNTKSYPVSIEVLDNSGRYRVGVEAPKKK